MATQRMTVATIAGDAGRSVHNRFAAWKVVQLQEPIRSVVDEFAKHLRENSASLPVVYFCEWIDRWLMGDAIQGPLSVHGARWQASCQSPEEARQWAMNVGTQWPEQRRLAACLLEAAGAWNGLVGEAVVVVLREILGASATDEEVVASLRVIPPWLAGS